MNTNSNPDQPASSAKPSIWSAGTAGKATELAFFRWTMIWGCSLLLTLNAIRSGWVTGPVAWLLPSLTVLLSLVMAYRYWQFIEKADELMRKIQLESVALAFGVTAILIMSLETFEPLGAPQLEDNTVIAIMGVLWSAAQIWYRRRYL